LIVSPNPASDQLTVRGTIEGSATLLFDIFTTEGKLVQRSTGSMSGTFAKRIDVQDMTAGAYMLKVRDAKGNAIGTARFTISK
jgi:hypothetical protein